MQPSSAHPLASGALLVVSAFPSLVAAELASSGYVETGVEYRSNPVIAELDAAASESDSAALLRAGISTQWHADDAWSLYGGYDLDTRRYRKLKQFDLTLHVGHVGARYELAATTLGLEHHRARASLETDWFFAQQHTTAFVERLLSQHGVLRAGLSAGNQTYDQLPERNASLKGAQVDLYWSPARPDLFAIGAAIDRTDSRSPGYRYEARALNLRYQRDFSALGLNHQAGLGWRYQQRDYEHPESASADAIASRQRWQASVETELNEHFALTMAAERGDTSLADISGGYRDDRVSLTLKALF